MAVLVRKMFEEIRIRIRKRKRLLLVRLLLWEVGPDSVENLFNGNVCQDLCDPKKGQVGERVVSLAVIEAGTKFVLLKAGVDDSKGVIKSRSGGALMIGPTNTIEDNVNKSRPDSSLCLSLVES
ncbi:hypothetical protein ACOSQ4_024747 [Xanthoceras sorbifolium]